jgi:hypothetical protein
VLRAISPIEDNDKIMIENNNFFLFIVYLLKKVLYHNNIENNKRIRRFLMSELRAYKRYKSSGETIANIEKFEIEVIDVNPLLISLVDISEGGLCIHIKNPINVDNHVKLKMVINLEKFILIAKVVWTKDYAKYEEAGLELVYVDEPFINALRLMIDNSGRNAYLA